MKTVHLQSQIDVGNLSTTLKQAEKPTLEWESYVFAVLHCFPLFCFAFRFEISFISAIKRYHFPSPAQLFENSVDARSRAKHCHPVSTGNYYKSLGLGCPARPLGWGAQLLPCDAAYPCPGKGRVGSVLSTRNDYNYVYAKCLATEKCGFKLHEIIVAFRK